jgi:hypothetical protein
MTPFVIRHDLALVRDQKKDMPMVKNLVAAKRCAQSARPLDPNLRPSVDHKNARFSHKSPIPAFTCLIAQKALKVGKSYTRFPI